MKLSKSDFVRSLFLMTFAALLTACGGPIAQTVLPGIERAAQHLTTSFSSGQRAYKPEAGVKAMMLFQASGPAPSQLQQSFQAHCAVTGDPTAVTSTSLVPLDLGLDANDCNGFFSSANPIFGSQIIKDGTISTLVVQANSSAPDGSSQSRNLVCTDLTNSGPVTDGSFVSVYFRPSDNTVLVFSGTTQLPVTCTLTVPAGERVTQVAAGFIKS